MSAARCFYIGPTLPPPELLRAAYLATKDPFPTARERAVMPHDEQDDPREPPATLAPETDREPERKTLPPGAADAEATHHMQTILPKNPWAEPPDWWEGSFFQSVFNDLKTATQRVADADEANQRREELAKENHGATIDAIVRAEASNNASWEGMRAQLDVWRKVSEAKDADQDSKITALETKLAKLEGEVAEMKRVLVEIKKNAPAASSATAPTG